MPRLIARQRHFDDVAVSTAEDYFRVSVFFPFLDHFRMQLSERFKKQKTVEHLSDLLPHNIAKAEKSLDFEQIFSLYGPFVSLNELP